jgi:hypothetical protein
VANSHVQWQKYKHGNIYAQQEYTIMSVRYGFFKKETKSKWKKLYQERTCNPKAYRLQS